MAKRPSARARIPDTATIYAIFQKTMVKNKTKLKLVLPNKKYVKSFANCLKEARQEGIPQFRHELEIFHSPKDFSRYLKYVYNYRNGVDLEEGKVPQTVYWAIVGSRFVGILKLRHK